MIYVQCASDLYYCIGVTILHQNITGDHLFAQALVSTNISTLVQDYLHVEAEKKTRVFARVWLKHWRDQPSTRVLQPVFIIMAMHISRYTWSCTLRAFVFLCEKVF